MFLQCKIGKKLSLRFQSHDKYELLLKVKTHFIGEYS
jgi:hypothetical protein